jgi:hypothetical protein
MLLDDTNSALDTCLHGVRIAGNNLQGNVMKVAEILEFATNKLFSSIRKNLGTRFVIVIYSASKSMGSERVLVLKERHAQYLYPR